MGRVGSGGSGGEGGVIAGSRCLGLPSRGREWWEESKTLQLSVGFFLLLLLSFRIVDVTIIGGSGTFSSWNTNLESTLNIGGFPYTGSAQISGSLVVTGSMFVTASSVISLAPSNPLPSGVNSGSLAVTGSNLAFYDGTSWKKVTIGSF